MNLWAFTSTNARPFAEGLRGEVRTLRGWGSRSVDQAALQAEGALAVHFEIAEPLVEGTADQWASGVVRSVHWACDASDALLEWACRVADRSVAGPPDQCRAARAILDMVAGWARGSVEAGTLAMVRDVHLEDVERAARAGTLRGAASVGRLARLERGPKLWLHSIDAVILARGARRGEASEIEAMRQQDAEDLVRILDDHRARHRATSATIEGGAA